MGDPSELTTGASKERREVWQKYTGLPFDPIECSSVLTSQRLECPDCGKAVEARMQPSLYPNQIPPVDTMSQHISPREGQDSLNNNSPSLANKEAL